MLTTRIAPSFPACTVTILPSGHCNDGILSSFITTRSPTKTVFCFLVHFDRLCISCRYSWLHLFQKIPSDLCPGVNAERSRGLEVMGVRGREFNIASMSIATVFNSSYVKSAVDTVRINKCFADFTAASHSLQK